jgi:Kef-type K+ transport system membrane component KefB
MTLLLAFSIILIGGLLSTRLMKILKLPNVTCYLIVGILLGPYLWKVVGLPGAAIITEKYLDALNIFVSVALGFIAFSIGGEFKISALKKIGKKIFFITFTQSFLALFLVDLVLILVCYFMGNLQEQLPLIIVLGAVATATAPAATLMVIKQYRAKGPLTDTLLPVVALDDAFGLVAYAISFAIAKTFAMGTDITLYSVCIKPLLEIIVSIAVGSLIGFLLSYACKYFLSRANRLTLMIVSTVLGVALCEIAINQFHFEMSSLLTCMMIGAVFCNVRQDSQIIMDGCERWTPPLFMLFFVLSGAELDFTIMGQTIVLIIGALYLIARSIGKIYGAYFGCKVCKLDKNVTKYLGYTLLPQAGVAIGMAHSAANAFRGICTISATITAVVLCATLVYELFGPLVTKISLKKAGEIKE